MTKFLTKRIYEEAADSDGFRVLIDRLWPRGVSKIKADLDQWAKELAPSTELRKWFNHVPARFDEFAKRYQAELGQNPDFDSYMAEWQKHATVTLLYGAKDTKHNEVVVLAAYIKSYLAK